MTLADAQLLDTSRGTLRRAPVERWLSVRWKIPGLSADKHRPLAHVRSRSTASPAVLATGTTFCAAAVANDSRVTIRISTACSLRTQCPVRRALELADRVYVNGATRVADQFCEDRLSQRTLVEILPQAQSLFDSKGRTGVDAEWAPRAQDGLQRRDLQLPAQRGGLGLALGCEAAGGLLGHVSNERGMNFGQPMLRWGFFQFDGDVDVHEHVVSQCRINFDNSNGIWPDRMSGLTQLAPFQ